MIDLVKSQGAPDLLEIQYPAAFLTYGSKDGKRADTLVMEIFRKAGDTKTIQTAFFTTEDRDFREEDPMVDVTIGNLLDKHRVSSLVYRGEDGITRVTLIERPKPLP